MKKSFYLVLCFFIIGSVLPASAALINVGAGDGITIDGSGYILKSEEPTGKPPIDPPPGLMWEYATDHWKACICRMVGYRALQALDQHLGLGNINSSSINILTGWNTDGPEEIFVDNMPWTEDDLTYADPITANEDLTLGDAWYKFSIEGTGTYLVSSQAVNYTIDADIEHSGHQEGWDFFAYRTYFKTHSGMDDTKMYFKDVARPQIVENFKGATSFDVTPVPLPAAFWFLGSGLAGLIAFKRKTNPDGC
ncbi:MAG: VPLPA-CTERM sorting domain-containing protein [Desulfosarcina sp.]|nr:VPLPA-CTERM sorting domain-containing protein [Desulfobacterales bacterium]